MRRAARCSAWSQAVVLHDVAHGELPLPGFGAVHVVVPAPELRLRHRRVQLALHHDPGVGHVGGHPGHVVVPAELHRLPRHVVDAVVVVVEPLPVGFHHGPGVLGPVEQVVDRHLPGLPGGVVIPRHRGSLVFSHVLLLLRSRIGLKDMDTLRCKRPSIPGSSLRKRASGTKETRISCRRCPRRR